MELLTQSLLPKLMLERRQWFLDKSKMKPQSHYKSHHQHKWQIVILQRVHLVLIKGSILTSVPHSNFKVQSRMNWNY